MGSSASKSATKVAGSAARKYPTRIPTTATQTPTAPPAAPAAAAAAAAASPGPAVHTAAQAAETRTEAIEKDAKDPALAARLNQLGAVQPNPHYSPTSTSQFDPQRRREPPSTARSHPDMMQAPPQSAFPDPRNNPVLRVLEARQRITDQAEDETRSMGRSGFAGRTYVDASTIQLALMRQAKGEPSNRIEAALGIKKGRLSVLGKGMISNV